MDNNERRRGLLRAVSIVLGVVLVVMVAVTVYAEHLLNQMNYVDPNATGPSLSQEEIDAILNPGDETEDPNYTGPTMNDEDVELGEAGAEIGDDEHIINILLIGADYQETDRPRSDTTILVTVNRETGKLTMTSFMRDLYVKIPGYAKNKLNAAYSLGGMNLLQDTLYENFGILVDGVIEVDFMQFEKIINLLGGIDLELSKQEAAWINMKCGSKLEPGMQHLNGVEAMWYSRNRTSDGGGDYNRTNRQRIVLMTIIETYKSAKITTILGMLNEILPMITTNMTKETIVDYVLEVFPLMMDAEIISQRIPIGDGTDLKTGHLMTKVNELSVLLPNIELNVQFLLETLDGE